METLDLVLVGGVVPVAFVLFGKRHLDEVNDGSGERSVLGYRL